MVLQFRFVAASTKARHNHSSLAFEAVRTEANEILTDNAYTTTIVHNKLFSQNA